MGRKALMLTPAQKAEVETLAAVLNAQQIADYFGIGRTTFFAMVERDPEIAERYKRGKARAVGAIAQSLITKARSGDTACMICYLKAQAGWRERSVMEVEPLDAPEESAAALGAREKLMALIARASEARRGDGISFEGERAP